MTQAKPAPPGWVPGAIIPTYRHVSALPAVVAAARQAGLPVVIVDDGNAPEIAQAIVAIAAADDDIELVRRARNGGKGAAMKTGLSAAQRAGWTHAVQIDADGQHDLSRLPDLLAASRVNPQAVICGRPEYDDSIPNARKFGRRITHFWVWVETLSREITDSMCGFRVYPLADTMAVLKREVIGNRMDFDTEILVHLNWRGARMLDVPVRVSYPEGNLSNFRILRDNILISAMHTRLALQMPVRAPIRWWRRRQDRYPFPTTQG